MKKSYIPFLSPKWLQNAPFFTFSTLITLILILTIFHQLTLLYPSLGLHMLWRWHFGETHSLGDRGQYSFFQHTPNAVFPPHLPVNVEIHTIDLDNYWPPSVGRCLIGWNQFRQIKRVAARGSYTKWKNKKMKIWKITFNFRAVANKDGR